MLTIPLLLLFALGKSPAQSEAALADFSRFANAINQEIAIVDVDGIVREGVLASVADDHVSVRFRSGTKTFSRESVAAAERLNDGRRDGAIKGALIGAFMGAVMAEAYNRHGGSKARVWATHVAIYGGIGFLLDGAQTNRQPIYRSPIAAVQAKKASMSLSFRF
jgi:hypothetical protein